MTLPAKDIDRQVDARLKKLARDVRMPGFRPGKVPSSWSRRPTARRFARKC